MTDPQNAIDVVVRLNGLAGGLFLLTAFGMIAMRQVLGCLNLFYCSRFSWLPLR